MYSLPRGPSKFVTNTRRGPAKGQIESIDVWDRQHVPAGPVMTAAPRPVFNGKRNIHTRPANVQQEPPSEQHEDIVRFLSDAWNKVYHEYEMYSKSQREDGPIWYREKNPNPKLAGFKPFDIDEFWCSRTYQQMTSES